MSPETYRSVIVERRQRATGESLTTDPDTSRDRVAMDDRDEERELLALLIMREDRRRGMRAIPPGNRTDAAA